MLDEDDWRILLESFSSGECQTQVTTFFEISRSFSRPARVSCSDGNEFWIEGSQVGRPIFVEQVVGAIGHRIDAPVPEIRIVALDSALTKAEPGLSHFVPGYVHASKREIDCTDRDAFRYYDEPDNRSRFAALSVLYTWTGATDHQFIYKKQMPHLVFSVDHGHFFFGTAWTEASLGSAAPATRLDPSFDIANLTSAEIAPVLDALGASYRT